MNEEITPAELRVVAKALERLGRLAYTDTQTNSAVTGLLHDHLTPAQLERSIVGREWAAFEQVNLQVAIDHWLDRSGRTVVVHGLTIPANYGPIDLSQLVAADGLPPIKVGAPTYQDLPDGPGSTRACIDQALLQISDEHGRYLLFLRGPNDYHPHVLVQLLGLEVGASQAVLAELDELRSRFNVYRGRLINVEASPHGNVQLVFADEPGVARADLVLPADTLARVERHTLGIAAQRAALRSAGQHLKRGVLLYGPPGTGKTHTTRYLLGQLTGYTRLLLSGSALDHVAALTKLARELQPATVVLEDVDLVAMDRDYGHPHGVLFALLDAMDGLDADADLLFLLTTNRAEHLERALAARPGRVDLSAEIPLPDAQCRAKLFALYGRSVPLTLTAAETDAVVARMDGVTASFVKELLRRSVLEALAEQQTLVEVNATHLGRALDDLLDASEALNRTLLGANSGDSPEHDSTDRWIE